MFNAFRKNFCRIPIGRRTLSQSPYAFVFDIDGVLMRGSNPIPQAHAALTLLKQENVPFILLTNGGGVTEKSRVEFLSEKLQTEISPLQIVQSHTPMKAWAQEGRYKRVLVVGGEKDNARQAALEYGYENVVIPMDIVRQNPAIAPHHRYTTAEMTQFGRDVDLSQPLDAILVFNDPRDLGTDIQVISDVLNSENGVVGTKRPVHSATPAVPLVFSNDDYLWANDYNLPRFGQGAVRLMLETLYAKTNALSTGEALQSTILGKPFRISHDYAHWVLIEWNKIMHGHEPHGFRPPVGVTPEKSPFRKIYMVGDNPESDIHGAIANGWESILLRTGVYRDADWETTKYRPSVGVFDNVLDSVQEVVENWRRNK